MSLSSEANANIPTKNFDQSNLSDIPLLAILLGLTNNSSEFTNNFSSAKSLTKVTDQAIEEGHLASTLKETAQVGRTKTADFGRTLLLKVSTRRR